jgi:DNA-binding CsgD family transcriptional regulator
MVYVAAPLVLREGDRGRLEGLTRSPSAPAGLVKRARIVLLAAEGLPNTEIAVMVGASRPTVISWRERYEQGGMAGLADQKRSHGPARVPGRTRPGFSEPARFRLMHHAHLVETNGDSHRLAQALSGQGVTPLT